MYTLRFVHDKDILRCWGKSAKDALEGISNPSPAIESRVHYSNNKTHASLLPWAGDKVQTRMCIARLSLGSAPVKAAFFDTSKWQALTHRVRGVVIDDKHARLYLTPNPDCTCLAA
jgi:hypothetical protein